MVLTTTLIGLVQSLHLDSNRGNHGRMIQIGERERMLFCLHRYGCFRLDTMKG